MEQPDVKLTVWFRNSRARLVSDKATSEQGRRCQGYAPRQSWWVRLGGIDFFRQLALP